MFTILSSALAVMRRHPYHVMAWGITLVLAFLPFVLSEDAMKVFSVVSGGLAATAAIIAAVFTWHVPADAEPQRTWRSAEYWSTAAGIWGAAAVAVIVAHILKDWPF